MAERCYHCHEPVPAGVSLHTTVLGQARPMCCVGCQAVSQAIVDGGLTDYYKFRTDAAEKAELVPQALSAYDSAEIQQQFVHQDGNSCEITLSVDNLSCAACAWLIEKQLGRLPGVERIAVNATSHRALVRWQADKTPLSHLLAELARIGYPALPFEPNQQEAYYREESRSLLLRLGLAGLATMQVMMFAFALYVGVGDDFEQYFRLVSLALATPVALYSAQPFYIAAWRGLRHGQPGMDVPVSLAILGAYLASAFATLTGTGEVYFESISMFTFLLLSGRLLELRARRQAAQSSANLLKLVPAVAWQQQANGDFAQVPVSQLAVGDCLQIRPGEKVPTDVVLVTGNSELDESFLTGESIPVAKNVGDPLFAGSVNLHSPLTVKVTAIGQDNLVAGIVRLQDQAQAEKPRAARLADQVARWFVMGLLSIAALTFVFWYGFRPADAFWVTLSVLVATCPCALSLATPTAITCAMSSLSRLGWLVRRGQSLEVLPHIDTVVFDKTGTLTEGRLTLEKTVSDDDKYWLAVAAALEQGSEHPLAQVFLPYATALRADAVSNHPGGGIEGWIGQQHYRLGSAAFVGSDGDANVYLLENGQQVAAFWFKDVLRADAKALVDTLRATGKQVILMTGDGSRLADTVANSLNMTLAKGLTPAAKLAQVKALQAKGQRVMMVGDGINDAPVLAGADVSVAMASGTELAHSAADIVLLGDDIGKIAKALTLARQTRRVIIENYSWAVAYNAVVLPVAVAGLVSPWLAALGMSLSSLLVLGNSLRLLRAS
ncbi:heavy metal translocating P-type ATPase [Gallaecimonas sp. GXIMD1310]|uniref:heavy metal translocating P-type ATPase n=1 Tax=Gallaecimonas sp. GXIMD1310 TaxID=3131926 RepID=UPI00325444F5